MYSTTSIIVLPDGFVASIGAQAVTVITALSPLLSLIIGVLLAVFAIGAILSWVKH